MIYVPKSIDFASMDDLEFKELYDKFVDIALNSFGLDYSVIERIATNF